MCLLPPRMIGGKIRCARIGLLRRGNSLGRSQNSLALQHTEPLFWMHLAFSHEIVRVIWWVNRPADKLHFFRFVCVCLWICIWWEITDLPSYFIYLFILSQLNTNFWEWTSDSTLKNRFFVLLLLLLAFLAQLGKYVAGTNIVTCVPNK